MASEKIDKNEARQAKRVKGMPLVLGIGTIVAIVIIFALMASFM